MIKPTKADIDRQIKDALEKQFIRNVEYEFLKDWANRLVYDAFKVEIQDKIYKLSNDNPSLKDDAYMIVVEFAVMGLYEIPSRIKKLEAWKAKPDKNIKDWKKPFNSSLMVDLEGFFSQWQQLATDFVALKSFVKKGRMPGNTKPKESKNPTGTCQICQREICLMPGDGTIFLHGYQRPGDGFVVGKCEGAKYLPYEQSCDRAKELKSQYEKGLTSSEKILQSLETTEVIFWKEQEIDRSHPHWNKAFSSTRNEIDFHIRGLKSEIIRLTDLINKWKPIL
jgi:hypothetical protein